VQVTDCSDSGMKPEVDCVEFFFVCTRRYGICNLRFRGTNRLINSISVLRFLNQILKKINIEIIAMVDNYNSTGDRRCTDALT